MTRIFDRTFRFFCAAMAGAQLFFAAVAAQVVFSKDVAALPHGDPRKNLAAEQVGQMLVRLDTLAMVVGAVAVGLAVLLSARNWTPGSLRRALQPLLAALCACASMFGTTPAIQAMRAADRVGEKAFGQLHALSALLLLLQMILFAWAALRPEGSASRAATLDATGDAR